MSRLGIVEKTEEAKNGASILFHGLDKDKDGYLNFEEFTKMLKHKVVIDWLKLIAIILTILIIIQKNNLKIFHYKFLKCLI